MVSYIIVVCLACTAKSSLKEQLPESFDNVSMVWLVLRTVVHIFYLFTATLCFAIIAMSLKNEYKYTEQGFWYHLSVLFWLIPLAWYVAIWAAVIHIVPSFSSRAVLLDKTSYKKVDL